MKEIVPTPEQLARQDEFRDKWTEFATSTEPANRDLAEQGIIEAYAGLELPAPEIRWVDNPNEGAREAAKLQFETSRPTKEQINQVLMNSTLYGQHEAPWYAFFDYASEVLGLDFPAAVPGLMKVGQNAGWWWPYESVAVVCERPITMKWDEEWRPHASDGPALAWRGGWERYLWHGIEVDKQVILDPENIDPHKIFSERNAEVRRIMMERKTPQRMFAELEAELIHEDVDQFGQPRRLLRIAVQGDEDLMVVAVKNSTPEPDGSIRDYLLPVNPELRPLTDGRPDGPAQELTCANAVASTFGLTGKDYDPIRES